MATAKQIPTLKRYRLTLRHVANPDVTPDGYWQPATDPALVIECADTLEEARDMFTAWRDRNGIGGGNLRQAEVSEKGRPVCRFSYNGKAWEPGPWKSGDKPLHLTEPKI